MKREVNEAAVNELRELVKAKKEIEREIYDKEQEVIWEPDDAKAVKLYNELRDLRRKLHAAEDDLDEFVESF